MADTKSAKKSKSKSSNNSKATKLSSQSQVTTNKSSGVAGQKNEVFKSKPRSSVPGSILNKLDLEHLKERALKNMRKGGIFPYPAATREACIEYVLDMVIGNLILNGHLDVNKAQKMRNPLMKSQISALCDDMISAKTAISNASHAKYYRGRKKSSSTKSKSKPKTRSRSKAQKWAIQPAALPITIVTDQQNLSKLPNVTAMEKTTASLKETGSMRSLRIASTDDIKKQKPASSKSRTKSLETPTERSASKSKPQNSPATQSERTNVYRQQASSEVPSSNHSLENNMKLLSSTNNVAEKKTSKVKIAQKADQGPSSASSTKKQVDDNKKIFSSTTSNTKNNNNNNIEKSDDKKEATKTLVTSQEEPSSDRNQVFTAVVPVTACLPSIPSRTLNTFINNENCSVPSTASTGYQVLVDMKGFQNDEISMEVEGRQLIFLASRTRKGEGNVRKVTEIVDVPAKVNMENLKIGRRIDGYVLIEEHEL